MSPLVRSVTALALVISLSCAGPLEEAGGVRFAPDEAETPGTAALTLERVRGEPPLEVSNLEVARTLRMLAPQLKRVARDPDLARRRMLEVEPTPELEGLLLDGAVRGRIVLASAELTGAQREALTHAYLRHCRETHGREGDCLNVMNGEQSLGQGARYRLACHFALASVWEGMAEELGDMVDLDRLASAVIFGFASWAVLVVVPEPISKILAAGLTVVMAAWLGVDALLNVIGGWMEMAAAADQATTLPELMKAGRAYGERMGRHTVRLVVMLVASFIADKGVANLPKLPKFNLATRRLAAAGGPGLEVVSAAEQATVTESRVTIVYAKAAKGVKVGAAAAGTGSSVRCTELTEEGAEIQVDAIPKHHICTDKNSVSTVNGGPWTPRCEEIFSRAGMTLDDLKNIVDVPFHQGPHPREYHMFVIDELSRALGQCRTVTACREKLVPALKRLSDKIRKPGSRLNNLVTQGCGARK